jgi:hypothetical protein
MMTIQQEQEANAQRRGVIAKLLLASVPLLVSAGVVVGGMRWAVNNLERQVAANLNSCEVADRAIEGRVERFSERVDGTLISLETRQLNVLQRLAALEAKLGLRDVSQSR